MISTFRHHSFGASAVAVVGAGGFLGINVARYLATRVRELRCFGRRCSFPDALQGFNWIVGDITDGQSVVKAIKGCDTVVHLAGASTPASADIDIVADAQVNIVGTLKLLDSCVLAGVRRVIYISSGGTVYGIPSIVPTPETAPTLPVTAYGVAKLAIENYLKVYKRLYGLDYRVLRVSNIYGPFQTAKKQQGVVAAFLRRAVNGMPLEVWGDGKVVRDYIYVGDVVDAIDRSISHEGDTRTFNIGSGTGVSLLEVIDVIERALGNPLERIFSHGRPVDVPISILDCAVATHELGWRAQTGIVEGFAHTLDWARGNLMQQSPGHW